LNVDFGHILKNTSLQLMQVRFSSMISNSVVIVQGTHDCHGPFLFLNGYFFNSLLWNCKYKNSGTNYVLSGHLQKFCLSSC